MSETTILPDDPEFEDFTITSVRRDGAWYEIGISGGVTTVEVSGGVVPRVGQTIRLWWRGWGGMIRGVAIDGVVVRYETWDQLRARWAEERRQQEERDRAEAAACEPESMRRIEALPGVFQARLRGFLRRNPDFIWRLLAYELFVCEQAVALADALQTPEALAAFRLLPPQAQRARVPELSDAHSGNTFGMVCRLAHWYLTQPENVISEHGALCPIVGCLDYGCPQAEEQPA